MTVREIVPAWLKEHGYSGLYDDGCGDPMCGCPLDDLFLCGDIYRDCKAGHRGPPTEPGSSWAIYPTKEACDAAIAEQERDA